MAVKILSEVLVLCCLVAGVTGIVLAVASLLT
jgi:hypothetical protein